MVKRVRGSATTNITYTCIRGGTRTATDFPYHSILSCHPRSLPLHHLLYTIAFPLRRPCRALPTAHTSRSLFAHPPSPILLGAAMERLTRSSLSPRTSLPFHDSLSFSLFSLRLLPIPLWWTECVSPVAVCIPHLLPFSSSLFPLSLRRPSRLLLVLHVSGTSRMVHRC